jgi:hypothetical protein
MLLGFWLHSVHILSYVCFGNLHRVECTRKIFHCTSDISSWYHHAVSDIRPAVINDTAPHARITDICICLVLLYKSDFNNIKYTWNIRLLFWVVWIVDSFPTQTTEAVQAQSYVCPSIYQFNHLSIGACLHSSTLIMEAAGSSETLAHIYKPARPAFTDGPNILLLSICCNQ